MTTKRKSKINTPFLFIWIGALLMPTVALISIFYPVLDPYILVMFVFSIFFLGIGGVLLIEPDNMWGYDGDEDDELGYEED